EPEIILLSRLTQQIKQIEAEIAIRIVSCCIARRLYAVCQQFSCAEFIEISLKCALNRLTGLIIFGRMRRLRLSPSLQKHGSRGFCHSSRPCLYRLAQIFKYSGERILQLLFGFAVPARFFVISCLSLRVVLFPMRKVGLGI